MHNLRAHARSVLRHCDVASCASERTRRAPTPAKAVSAMRHNIKGGSMRPGWRRGARRASVAAAPRPPGVMQAESTWSTRYEKVEQAVLEQGFARGQGRAVGTGVGDLMQHVSCGFGIWGLGYVVGCGIGMGLAAANVQQRRRVGAGSDRGMSRLCLKCGSDQLCHVSLPAWL